MAANYEVTNIRSTTVINATGQLVDMYEVFATTTAGDSFMVRVDKAMTKDQVQKAVDAEAVKLIGIRG